MATCLDCNGSVTTNAYIKFALPGSVVCYPCWFVRHPENIPKPVEKVARQQPAIVPVVVLPLPEYVPAPRPTKPVTFLPKPRRVVVYDDNDEVTPSVFSYERKKHKSQQPDMVGLDALDAALASVAEASKYGGILPLTREKVLYRDNYSCQVCGTNMHLTVHHIRPRSQGGDNRVDNLITLCAHCHDEVEIAGYKNRASIIGHTPQRR